MGLTAAQLDELRAKFVAAIEAAKGPANLFGTPLTSVQFRPGEWTRPLADAWRIAGSASGVSRPDGKPYHPKDTYEGWIGGPGLYHATDQLGDQEFGVTWAISGRVPGFENVTWPAPGREPIIDWAILKDFTPGELYANAAWAHGGVRYLAKLLRDASILPPGV